MTPGTVRKVLCDAEVTPVVLGGDSRPLDIGRSTRTIPPQIRNALNLRDGGCVIAGCQSRTRYCDAHHVVHWADGGPTSLDNLTLLCARHHTLVHEGRASLPDAVLDRARRRPNRV